MEGRLPHPRPDGFLPSDLATGSSEEIEEELRLTYVALTRAKDFLYVVWPLRYYHRWYAYGDAHSYAQLSRFFTDDVRKTMEEIFLAQPAEEEEAPSEVRPREDIPARLRAMWNIDEAHPG